MRRWSLLAAGFALFVAACGGSDASPEADVSETSIPITQGADTTDPPPTATPAPAEDPAPSSTEPPAAVPSDIVVRSDDGEFGMIVGGEESTTDVSIRLLESDEWPAEIAGASDSPGVKVYELEPDGATFDEPVMVSRRLDIASFSGLDLGPFDVPLVTLLTQTADGTYQMLDDLSLLRIGDDLYVSGSTLHFSPIIVTNENRMIPFAGEEVDQPVPPVPSDAYYDEFIEQTERALISSMSAASVGPAWVVFEEGQTPWAEAVQAILLTTIEFWENEDRDDTPFELESDDGIRLEDLPLVEANPPDPAPGPSPDDAAYRAQRYGTSFPFVPISMAPSAQILLDTSHTEFELTVAVLELLVPEGLLEVIGAEIVAEFDGTLEVPTFSEFTYEVFHRVFGSYPSSTVKRFGGLVLPEGVRAYSFSWAGGPPSPDSRLVAIVEAAFEGDDLVAETGIECFCSYSEGLLLVTGELDPALMNPDNSADFWAFATENQVALAVAVTDTETGQVLEFEVSADEGTTFEGRVGFAEIP
ncbi:MAG: hypothetical protein GXP35_07410 [Actinobacteria bacterium]|nr:hypothetical protein [Actinomycetota bacterium]